MTKNLVSSIFLKAPSGLIRLLSDSLAFKSSRSHTFVYFFCCKINFLPDDKILDLPKFKAFADDTLKMAQMLEFVTDRVDNIVAKGGHAA